VATLARFSVGHIRLHLLPRQEIRALVSRRRNLEGDNPGRGRTSAACPDTFALDLAKYGEDTVVDIMCRT